MLYLAIYLALGVWASYYVYTKHKRSTQIKVEYHKRQLKVLGHKKSRLMSFPRLDIRTITRETKEFESQMKYHDRCLGMLTTRQLTQG